MRCPNCGTELPNGTKFCTTCGCRLPEQPQTQPQPKPQNSNKMVMVIGIIIGVILLAGIAVLVISAMNRKPAGEESNSSQSEETGALPEETEGTAAGDFQTRLDAIRNMDFTGLAAADEIQVLNDWIAKAETAQAAGSTEEAEAALKQCEAMRDAFMQTGKTTLTVADLKVEDDGSLTFSLTIDGAELHPETDRFTVYESTDSGETYQKIDAQGSGNSSGWELKVTPQRDADGDIDSVFRIVYEGTGAYAFTHTGYAASTAAAEESSEEPEPAKEESSVEKTEASGINESQVEVEEEKDDDYVLPDSDTKRLSDADVRDLSKEELRLARNEIFARHGRLFKDQELQKYFNSKDWYKGTIAPDDFSESMLSDIEKANIDLIKKYE